MPSQPEDHPSPTSPRERRKQTRHEDPRWRTANTRIEPNKIAIRGYPVDELMGRLSFGEATYLILRGELPSRSIGKLFGAVLVSSIDHGVTRAEVPDDLLGRPRPLGAGYDIGAYEDQ
jgi:hypothetical protein